MKRQIIIFALFCTALLFLAQKNIAQTAEADAVLGVWNTDNNKSNIEIYKKDGKFFGKIIWLKEPNTPDGKPKVDKSNPDEKLRSRPLMGLNLLKDFVYDSDNVWTDGEIYNPEDGKTYSCKMTLSKDGKKLKVRGYVGISLFGKTVEWTKVK